MRDKGPGIPAEALGLEAKDLKKGKLYVEVGSGGSPAFFLAKRTLSPGDRYVTVDFDPWEAVVSKDFGEVVFGDAFEAVHGNGQNLPLESESVDEIIFNNVFGDQKTTEREKLLNEVVRVLKIDGQAVITEHITPIDFINEIGITKAQITAYLAKHGIDLKVKKISTSEHDAEGYIGKKEDRVIKGPPLQVILEK